MARSDNQRKLLGVGLGAGLLGAALLALKYAIRPPTKLPVPDSISPAIFATKVLHTSHGQIVYHESGGGPPLLFVHGVGVGASSYEWSKVYPAFALKFRVLAPDLIGFGESSRPMERLTAEDYSRTIAEFIRATCWEERPVIVASGLGAAFCVHLASQHPDLVKRLILFMPTGINDFGRRRMPLPTTVVSHIPLLSPFIYRNYLSTRSAITSWLIAYGFANARNVTEEVIDVLTTCAQQFGAEHAIRNFHAGRLNMDLEKRMPSLTQPVTLLWAEKADFPPLDWAQKFQALLNQSHLVVLQDCSLYAALESPDQMISILREELESDLRVFRVG
jgi:pimeloyl-ACP methyl ester carboxylesterase